MASLKENDICEEPDPLGHIPGRFASIRRLFFEKGLMVLPHPELGYGDQPNDEARARKLIAELGFQNAIIGNIGENEEDSLANVKGPYADLRRRLYEHGVKILPHPNDGFAELDFLQEALIRSVILRMGLENEIVNLEIKRMPDRSSGKKKWTGGVKTLKHAA